MGIAIGKPRRRDPRSAEPDQRTPPDGALPVVRPRARRRHDVRAAPVWLLLLPGGGRGQGGAPDWTNDLDAGEDRRNIAVAREPRTVTQPTGVTSGAR